MLAGSERIEKGCNSLERLRSGVAGQERASLVQEPGLLADVYEGAVPANPLRESLGRVNPSYDAAINSRGGPLTANQSTPLEHEYLATIDSIFFYADKQLSLSMMYWRREALASSTHKLFHDIKNVYPPERHGIKEILSIIAKLEVLGLSREQRASLASRYQYLKKRREEASKLKKFLQEKFSPQRIYTREWSIAKFIGLANLVQAFVQMREAALPMDVRREQKIDFKVYEFKNYECRQLVITFFNSFLADKGANFKQFAHLEAEFKLDLFNITSKIKEVSQYLANLFASKKYFSLEMTFVKSYVCEYLVKTYYQKTPRVNNLEAAEIRKILDFLSYDRGYLQNLSQLAVSNEEKLWQTALSNSEFISRRAVLETDISATIFAAAKKNFLKDKGVLLSSQNAEGSFREEAFSVNSGASSSAPFITDPLGASSLDLDRQQEYLRQIETVADVLFLYAEDKELNTRLANQVIEEEDRIGYKEELIDFLQGFFIGEDAHTPIGKIIQVLPLEAILEAFLKIRCFVITGDHNQPKDYDFRAKDCHGIVQELVKSFIGVSAPNFSVAEEVLARFLEDVDNIIKSMRMLMDYLSLLFKELNYSYSGIGYLNGDACKYVIAQYYENYTKISNWQVKKADILEFLLKHDTYLLDVSKIILTKRRLEPLYVKTCCRSLVIDQEHIKNSLKMLFLSKLSEFKGEGGILLPDAKVGFSEYLAYRPRATLDGINYANSRSTTNNLEQSSRVKEVVNDIFKFTEQEARILPNYQEVSKQIFTYKETLNKFLQNFLGGCYVATDIGKIVQLIGLEGIKEAFINLRLVARGNNNNVGAGLYEFSPKDCWLIVQRMVQGFMEKHIHDFLQAPNLEADFKKDILEICTFIQEIFAALKMVFRENGHEDLDVCYVKASLCLYVVSEYYQDSDGAQSYKLNIFEVYAMLANDREYLLHISKVLAAKTTISPLGPEKIQENFQYWQSIFVSKYLRFLDAPETSPEPELSFATKGNEQLKKEIIDVVNTISAFADEHMVRNIERLSLILRSLGDAILSITSGAENRAGFDLNQRKIANFKQWGQTFKEQPQRFLTLNFREREQILHLLQDLDALEVSKKSFSDFLEQLFILANDRESLLVRRIGLDNILSAFINLRAAALGSANPASQYQFSFSFSIKLLKSLLSLFVERIEADTHPRVIFSNFAEDIRKLTEELKDLPLKLSHMLGRDIYPYPELSFVPAELCMLVINTYYGEAPSLVINKAKILNELLVDQEYLTEASLRICVSKKLVLEKEQLSVRCGIVEAIQRQLSSMKI